MPFASFRRIARNAREAEHRQNVDVVPFEGDGERKDVELTDRRLRLNRDERRARRQQLGQFLFRRQEDALAHDVVLRIQQAIHGLEAEVRHPDPISIGKRQGDAQPIAVRLDDVAGLFVEGGPCALALLPGLQCCQNCGPIGATDPPADEAPAWPELLGSAVRPLTLRRRRSRIPWVYLLYHRKDRCLTRSPRPITPRAVEGRPERRNGY